MALLLARNDWGYIQFKEPRLVQKAAHKELISFPAPTTQKAAFCVLLGFTPPMRLLLPARHVLVGNIQLTGRHFVRRAAL